MDMSQYLEVFIEESKEHLQNINQQLLEFEKDVNNLSFVNEIFRSAHTLKGMSATMGFEDLANLTHKMENVLDAIRNQQLSVNTRVVDLVFESVDALDVMVESIATGGDGGYDVQEIVTKLQALESGGLEVAAATESKVVSPSIVYDEFETDLLNQALQQEFFVYEVTVTLDERCLLKAARAYMVFDVFEQAGEVVKSNPSVQDIEQEQFDQQFTAVLVSKEEESSLKEQLMQISEVEHVQINTVEPKENVATDSEKQTSRPQQSNTKRADDLNVKETAPAKTAPINKTIRVNIDRLDSLMNLFEELVIDRGRLEQISKDLNNQELEETVERMSRISGDLQSIILNMRMVPVETVFNRFPRMVRQLAKDLGKEINLQIIGAETELDRTVIDEIGDPLVHLLRNALDHGIEMPDVREQNGKKREGTVRLKAYHSGNHVFIDLEDDGAGIDRDKILEKALKKGIVSETGAQGLTDQQVYDLMFASGFSTAEQISDVSGRGVGLDVVKNTIESLGGTVTIDSIPGYGSTFSIQLPLTLSIISALLVNMQDERYALPLSSIIETALVNKKDVMKAHGQEVIDFRGKIIPLLNLKKLFDVPETSEEKDVYPVVIVRKSDKTAGLIVDSFIGQQEIVLKSLGNYLTSPFAISGATILGDGQVALIIDCNALIK
ncbi:chemotaxis protein CheA [Priestia flexa]|uniref:chemotaxis protein CheA n=1 Tax=Priestia TaxID=2800373 RepID=UPI00077C2E3B|nr:chemotaxis protein CheA [Priestia flexa]AQX54067.1 chemotaxis protein CheA [Priestia flexa]MBY6084773.1 chemotaxis protein CheA [Priestia flexa]MCA1200302.1 chemotaxis protein CheA [Priestia flexa]MCG7312218.1 chemotaxis protein CheA [Priestia flexa]MCM3065595.1 chemotaxis protein CheA [Priestia flexa]